MTKKFLSILLALSMVVCLGAIPISAEETDEYPIMPIASKSSFYVFRQRHYKLFVDQKWWYCYCSY